MEASLRCFAIVAFGIVHLANGQCPSSASAATDAANCGNWKARGYCTSSFYTQAQKQATCGFTCGLCTGTSSAAATCSGADTSAYCAQWLARGFCRSTFYTVAQRLSFCCASCLPIINSLTATTTAAAAAVTAVTTPAATTTANTACATVTTTTNGGVTNIPNTGANTPLTGKTVSAWTVVRATCNLQFLGAGGNAGAVKTMAGAPTAGNPEIAATAATCSCTA